MVHGVAVHDVDAADSAHLEGSCDLGCAEGLQLPVVVGFAVELGGLVLAGELLGCVEFLSCLRLGCRSHMFAREKPSNDLLDSDSSEVLGSHRQLPGLADDFLGSQYAHFGLGFEQVVRLFALHITRHSGTWRTSCVRQYADSYQKVWEPAQCT